jgi:anthranilate phosphoribosyltransferase
MKKVLQYLLEHKNLTSDLAKETMLNIGKGNYTEAEIAAFVTVYLMRTVTIEELVGFRAALIEMYIPIKIDADVFTDIVGTGGDGKNTFNISTVASFIVAGAGIKVVKHGNYGVSSISGSSNVLEYLGYQFSADESVINTQLKVANISFLHAPLFHPALQNVAQMRRNLGLRTIFNILGPIVNPANPTHATLGVYHLEIARFYNYLLQQTALQYNIIHTLDGYDELALTDDAKIITAFGETIASPMELGKRLVSLADIGGGNSIAAAAKIFTDILNVNGTWAQHAVAIANAAIVIQNVKLIDYHSAYQLAVESLESKKALKVFNCLLKTN